MLITVVVCTRDRAQRLALMLDRLAVAVSAFAGACELVVVDNGSRDHTEAVSRQFAASAAFPVRLVRESTPGLSVARNAGLAAARGTMVAFTDDDCLVGRDWLTAIGRRLDERGGVSLVGGKVTLDDPQDLPVAIRPFDDAVEIEDFSRLLERLIGCNFAVRRAVIERIGTFDRRLGAGTRAGSAEDLDLFYRALRAGERLAYDPDVAVAHAHGRRQPVQLVPLNRAYATGRGAFYAKHIMRGDMKMARHLAWELRAQGPRAHGVALALLQGALLRLTGR